MSKGTARYTVRLPDDLMEEVGVAIARRNENSIEEAWSLSDFIRVALAEKLNKMERSRAGKQERRRKAIVESKEVLPLNQPVLVELGEGGQE